DLRDPSNFSFVGNAGAGDARPVCELEHDIIGKGMGLGVQTASAITPWLQNGGLGRALANPALDGGVVRAADIVLGRFGRDDFKSGDLKIEFQGGIDLAGVAADRYRDERLSALIDLDGWLRISGVRFG